MRRITQIAISALSAVLLLVWCLASPVRAETPGRAPNPAAAAAHALAAIDVGEPQDLILLFDLDQVEAEAEELRRRAGLRFDDAGVLSFKREGFRRLKGELFALEASGGAEVLRDYRNLPMSLARFRSRRALEKLLQHSGTAAVFRDAEIYPHLAYSLPFIKQPPLAAAGVTGGGEGVAVIDTGIDYTLAGFGSCTAPGIPAGCRVAASVDVTGNGVTLNRSANNHGTNVAGIVAGTAPGTSIVSINAFYQGGSTVSWILAGIDWAIDNRDAYHISALNMSLGDGGNYTSPCDRRTSNPFLVPLAGARSAGILPVASSGNSAFTGGMASPACTPGVVSVGAVYDANWGGPYGWGVCSDPASSAPDRIPCFSNSASFLTLLAPGAFVTAAGVQMAGTSQAAPHVSAAAAVLKSAHPADTLDQTVARLTSTGVAVTDARNGITFPRLNLLAALGAPANDNFAARAVLDGDAGSVAANNLGATREAGEPMHGGGEGGSSVWWSWTPARTGTASISGAGSGFGTLVSVYTGTGLDALTRIADAAGTGEATFVVQQGTEYLIAVDGMAGGSGGVVLTRQLTLQADLGVALALSGPAQMGSELTLGVQLRNGGPSVASGVTLSLPLPAGVRFASAPVGCSAGADAVTCQLGDLAPGETREVAVVVAPGEAGPLQFRAEAFSAVSDQDYGNNAAAVACTVFAPPEAVPGVSGWGAAGCALSLWALLRRRGRRPLGDAPR